MLMSKEQEAEKALEGVTKCNDQEESRQEEKRLQIRA